MQSFLDFIFPKTCVSCGKIGSYICKKCFLKIEFVDVPICPICQRQAIAGKTHPGCKKRLGLNGLVVACRYKGPIRAAIQKVKYRFVSDIHKILVDLICDSLWKFDLPKNIVLVPVPLHPKRENWRGFNQADLLARNLAERFGEKYRDDLLFRSVETKTQVGLTKEQRKENIKGVFRVNQAIIQNRKPFDCAQGKIISWLDGKNIILVDDVFTTGATMNEACKVLKQEGAGQVWAMAVALD